MKNKKAKIPASKLSVQDLSMQDLLRKAAAAFSAAPVKKLPCREVEQEKILDHLSTAVKEGHSRRVLYISGMPGTGKTASVLDAFRKMREDHSTPAFHLVHVNAMRLGSPTRVFTEIFQQLPPHCREHFTRAASSDHQQASRLSQMFAMHSAGQVVVLLLIDEIDYLVTPNQWVLYQVFDWLALSSAKLVIAAISNTMDLPERLLPRVASRFGIVRVNFEPYSKQQISTILRERLLSCGATGAVEEMALGLCAARVARNSGDIRKALQNCRLAVEERQKNEDQKGPVSIENINAAQNNLLQASPAVRAIAGLGVRAHRFLAAILKELHKADSDAVSLTKAVCHYEKLLRTTEIIDDTSKSSFLSEAIFLMRRLTTINLLRSHGQISNGSCSLSLGEALDTDELERALIGVEKDEGIREILRAPCVSL